MERNFLILLFFFPIIVRAQLLIDGRHVALDRQNGILLATIPESCFGTDATFSVTQEEGWQQFTIEDTFRSANISSASGSADENVCAFTFVNISAERKWNVTLKAKDGTSLNASLQFTFLPIVQLLGSFGNDYLDGTFIFSHPDSSATDTLTASIKWRGGVTNAASKHKRNYKLKFDSDQCFFGLRNDDKWMLDAGQPDVFRLRNRIAMDLWNDMATKPYYADKEPKALNGVRGRIVELFLNDEYRGIYNFSELMDRKQLKLKKIGKDGEIRGCLYKGVNWDHTRMFEFFDEYDNTKETLYGYEMKYPDLSDSDTTDWAPLYEANNTVIKFINEEFERYVDIYFDLPVLRDYSLFCSVVNAVDNSGKNMYWAVYDKTTTRRLTPTPWDLDATFGQRWGGMLVGEIEDLTSPAYMTDVDLFVIYRLFKDEACHFAEQLNERYQQLRQPGQVLCTDSLIGRFTKYYLALKNSGAANREEAKWSGDSDVWGDVIDFDAEYAYICNWIRQHLDIIDQTTFPLYYNKDFFDSLSTGMPAIGTTNDKYIYSLSGQRIQSSEKLQPGIYIRNGKKFLVR